MPARSVVAIKLERNIDKIIIFVSFKRPEWYYMIIKKNLFQKSSRPRQPVNASFSIHHCINKIQKGLSSHWFPTLLEPRFKCYKILKSIKNWFEKQKNAKIAVGYKTMTVEKCSCLMNYLVMNKTVRTYNLIPTQLKVISLFRGP